MSDDYGAFGIKQLWQMINAAKNDLELTHKQIGAWQRAQQMLNQHATALRGFRDQLAAKWPPESNAASAAYLSELDRLLEAVSATAHASSSNAVQIGHVTDVIEQTHKKLDGLHKGYVDNEAKLAHYNAQLDAIGSAVGAQKGSLIGGLARGASKVLTESPVADGAQEHLLHQAREAMTAASSAARDASANLQLPPEYIPPEIGGSHDEPRHLPGGDPGGVDRSVTVDNPVRTFGQSDQQPIGKKLSRPNSPHETGRQLPEGKSPLDVADLPHGTPHNPGPVLLERPTQGLPSHGPVLEGAPRVVPTIGGGAPLVNGGIVPNLIVGGSVQQRNSDGGQVRGVPMGGVSSSIPPMGMKASAGGGSMPAASSQFASRVEQGGVQKVNPVGGVIGQSGNGLVGQSPIGGQSGRSKKSDHARWDPDNPWSVDEGVVPVITPEPVQVIDPGPGIIGRDR